MLNQVDKALRDVSESDLREFSRSRKEPEWVMRIRLEAYRYLRSTSPDPCLDPLLEELSFRRIVEGYERPTVGGEKVEAAARRLGIPWGEVDVVASGFSVNMDNRVVEAVMKYIERSGIVLMSMDEAVKKYDFVKGWAFKALSPRSSRKATYNAMLWSGGPFVYIPRGIKVPQPLYSLFLIGKEGLGQTEHTLIVADEGSSLEWIEGCTIPIPVKYGVHMGALEAYALKGSRVRIVSINNWLDGIHHIPVKKVVGHEGSSTELTSIGFWAKTVNVAPTIELVGRGASGVVQNIGLYRGDQRVHTGPLIRMVAPETRGQVLNRTVVADRAKEEFIGRLRAERGAIGASGYMSCNTLLVGDEAESIADPSLDTSEKSVELMHEASVGKVSYEKLYYLALSGLDEEEATWLVVNGFFNPVVSKLPFDLQIEVRKVIELALKAR